MTYARLSAVYGFTFQAINAMPLAAIQAYMERIPAIQAEQRLIYGDAASLPWLKNPQKQIKDWQRRAYEDAQPKVASPAVLKMLGIGVEYAS